VISAKGTHTAMTAHTLADSPPSAVQAHTYLDDWRLVRLGEAFRFTKKPRDLRFDAYQAIPFTPMEYVPIGYPVFSAYQMRAVDELTSGTYIEDGDLLVAKITPSFENGKQGVIEGLPLSFALATTEVIPINEIPGVTDKHFLACYLLRSGVRSALAAKMEGSTGRQRLSVSTLANWEIMLPPLAEQRAIARVLRAAQDAIAVRRRQVTLERERKAALMQRLFTHGVCGEPTKQTEIGEMPQSWQVVRLGEIASIERGRFSHRPRNDPKFYGGHVPFIQTGDVTAANGRIYTYTQTLNEQGLAVSRVFPKGTIVITIAANIGYTGILEIDSAFPDSLIGITAGVGVDVQYLHYYLVTQQSEMDRRAPQGTQKNINIEFLAPWPIRLPTATEQQAIADTLAACDSHIAALEREIALHDELFRALLEELMSGRLSALALVGVEADVSAPVS